MIGVGQHQGRHQSVEPAGHQVAAETTGHSDGPSGETFNYFQQLQQQSNPAGADHLSASATPRPSMRGSCERQASRRSSDQSISDVDPDGEAAVLTVASAEEYAAKIYRLQQATLGPLKEDLADWLNKIMSMSNITAENFMDKLENGVIICRLAKIISHWCESREQDETSPHCHSNQRQPKTQQHHRATSLLKLDSTPTQAHQSQTLSPCQSKLSSSTVSVHSQIASSDGIRMDQIKIWEDARARTFYARDNVCNFIKWSKAFGVNQSVLFESDDLVLHANPRQVLLCLLDVARIACVKHGFTETPGLVKFEQEIGRERLAAEAGNNYDQCAQNSTDGYRSESLSRDRQANGSSTGASDILDSLQAHQKLSSLAKNSRSIAESTDVLIMRYCLHKEEKARKEAAELEAAKQRCEAENAVALVRCSEDEMSASTRSDLGKSSSPDSSSARSGAGSGATPADESDNLVTQTQLSDSGQLKHNLAYENRVDSLDSGEGRTESASTSHTSRTPVESETRRTPPILTGESTELDSKSGPLKKSTSSSSLISQTSSMGTSELSSSRSSLLSGQESTKRGISSDLDGKVMRIAKSYYGKGATKGVKRLSEGKYKIADRIVFVRLLKGHRVMVRIGGGWDTLENFLFRHKSDPSQVIDVDNLLPLETKMSFDKNHQLTPNHNKSSSKLPYYRQGSSASSTNLSLSNLSSSISPATSSTATPTKVASEINNTPNAALMSATDQAYHSQPSTPNKQIPYLLIHRGQNRQQFSGTIQSPMYTSHLPEAQAHRTTSTTDHRIPVAAQRMLPKGGRTLGSSRIPTASVTNLYPATLTTRATPSASKRSSTTNLHNGSTRAAKQEALRRLGRSSDSLQSDGQLRPTAHSRLQAHKNGFTFSPHQNGNLKKASKIDSQRRSTNSLVRQVNSVNS